MSINRHQSTDKTKTSKIQARSLRSYCSQEYESAACEARGDQAEPEEEEEEEQGEERGEGRFISFSR